MTGKVTPLPIKAQPPLQVTSVDGASSWLFGRQERYNPDLLAARKGGLRIYQRMQDDEQVKAVMRFKRDSIIGRGYEFAFEETELPEEEQKKRSRVMQETTRQLRGSFADGIVAVLKGMAFGYSITEMVTANIEVDGATYVGLAKLLSRDAASFSFDTDDYGTLKRFYQRVNARELDLDYGRFIHYVQNPDIDPYYGESELKAAYRPWFMKDLDLKLWAAYKERLAGGFVTMQLGESGILSGSPDYLSLQNILQNLRSAMGLILPKGVTAEVHMPTSTDVYEKAIQFHDLAIAKSLLIPNLLGLSHTGQTGAYAQSQTQLEAYFMTLATDTARIEQCLNDQLFRPLATQNWDDGEFPRFKFKKASEEHVKWVVQSWKDLAAAGGVLVTEADERHLRQMLNFPPRNENDVPLAKVKQDLVPPVAPLAPVGPDGKPVGALPDKPEPKDEPPPKQFTADDAKELIEDALKADREARESAALISEANAGRQRAEQQTEALKAQLNESTEKHASLAERFAEREAIIGRELEGIKDAVHVLSSRNLGGEAQKTTFTDARIKALLRVDFTVIAQRAGTIEQDAVDSGARLAARAVRRLLTDERMRELIDNDTADIGELKIDGTDVGKIKGAFRAALERAWSTGLMQAMDETGKARKEAYAEDVRKLRFADLRGKAADFFDSQAFRMAGNLTDGMRAIIQQELLNAVKSGARPEEVAATVYDRLIRKGFTTLDAVLVEESREEITKIAQQLLSESLGVSNVPAYLNTLARTNVFEAMNEARYAEFASPELADFVQALQFSAILDDRTTDICREMDGHVHSATSQVWDRYRPPLHFNCRSVLFAVTVLDGWDGQETEPPIGEPADGFG